MTSNALFHYILAFTVLFASSFAVFHGSEHITLESSDSVVDHIKTSSSHADPQHHHAIDQLQHDTIHPHTGEINHSIESLCEACLVLSNLAAYSLAYHSLEISKEEPKHTLFFSIHSPPPPFHTYLSRAPPGNA